MMIALSSITDVTQDNQLLILFCWIDMTDSKVHSLKGCQPCLIHALPISDTMLQGKAVSHVQ